jgi:hypothetical protein
MTIEQIQQLGELTDQAVQLNDIETLVKIKKILIQSQSESELFTITGIEWFESSMTGEQLMAVNKIV